MKDTHLKHHIIRGRTTSAGFSMVEAIFGLTLTMIGFSAIFSLQSAQMEASLSARDIGAASNVAEQAATILMRDSYEWTSLLIPGPRLNRERRVWHSLTEHPVDQNFQAHNSVDEAQGTDLRRQRFCVYYWLDPMQGLYEGLMNGRIQVVWSQNPVDQRSIYNICGEGNVENFDPKSGEWFSLTIPLTLRRHP